MPLYETTSDIGRMQIQLLALRLVQDDIATYGPLVRSTQEAHARVQAHLSAMEQNKPTPQTVLTDDLAVLTSRLEHLYAIQYAGLLVGYTGLKDPYRLEAVHPRYTTTVTLVGTTDEQPFLGLLGLLRLIREHQQAQGEENLFDHVQVMLYEAQETHSTLIASITYTIEENALTGIVEQTAGIDSILQGLGLPCSETLVSRT